MNALLKIQKQERRSLSFKIAGWAQVALLGWLMAWGDFSSRLEYVAVGTARIDCAPAQPEVPTKGEPSGSERVNPTQCDGYGALPGTTKPSALIGGANVASQLGWRSHYIDPTGFYYMGARNYAPDSGTFLSPDPLGHSASMDLYSYCDGDPVNQYDADGRFGKGGFDSAAGIVTGTAGLVYNGVGSAAYGVTSLGGLVPNSVSDIYANQWQGLKSTGNGLATLGGQISNGQFSQIAQELTGGANVSGFYRAGYATVGIASLFAGGEISNLGKLGRTGEVAGYAETLAKTEITVYRVFGGDARAQGFSWTTTHPETVSNFRNIAGLPSGGASGSINSAEFMIQGEVNVKDIIKYKSADPLDGNKGGLPELIIDPKNIKINNFSVLKP